MQDVEGMTFLQWCLPRLHLRWAGFRKVRRQLYKKLRQRLQDLDLPNLSLYRSYLETHPSEWSVLDEYCRIPISRFYRDKRVFEFLEHSVLPGLARQVLERREAKLRCWSLGCASGEEPYTLAIIWSLCVAPRFPELPIEIFGTDCSPDMIERAKTACYPPSSLNDLPPPWVEQAFTLSGERTFCVNDRVKSLVRFDVQDIRTRVPDGRFHLILCRNIAFTYFDEMLQRETLKKIKERLNSNGILVIGKTESLLQGDRDLEPWGTHVNVYRKTGYPAKLNPDSSTDRRVKS